jgi:hypothetical protein
MIRARSLFTLVLPSLLAGGLLLGSNPGLANPNDDDNPTPHRVRPPTPPAPPDPWGTPSNHRHHRHTSSNSSISVSIHDGRVQIDGLKESVSAQLAGMREMLRNDPGIPPAIRDRVTARLDRVDTILERRLGHLKADDPDQLGEQLGQMGDEIGQVMDGLGDDLSKLGDQLGKDFADKLSRDLSKSFRHMSPRNFQFHFDDKDNDKDNDKDKDNDASSDDPDDANVPTPPAPPAPPSALDADDEATHHAITDLGVLSLDGSQRATLRQL